MDILVVLKISLDDQAVVRKQGIARCFYIFLLINSTLAMWSQIGIILWPQSDPYNIFSIKCYFFFLLAG